MMRDAIRVALEDDIEFLCQRLVLANSPLAR